MISETDEVPIFNIPNNSGEYKVLQFENREMPYLRFQLVEPNRFHESILLRFATEILSETVKGKDREGRPLAYLPNDCPFRLVGGGRCDVDLSKKTILFYGNSEAYNIGINLEHLDKLRKQIPEWSLK